jgi:glycosyltransferase involved in cell wall biosynthesis
MPFMMPQEQLQWLKAPRMRIEGTPIAVTNSMYLAWVTRPDLRKLFDINTKGGAESYFVWWLGHGRRELGFASFFLTEDQRGYLDEPAGSVVQDTSVPISRMLMMIWRSRTDLQDAFNLDAGRGREDLVQWWIRYGIEEYSCQSEGDIACGSMQETTFEKGLTVWAGLAESEEPVGAAFGSYADGGLNLVGFARGELGIGEDLRMAAASLKANGFPFTVFDAPIHLCSRSEDRRLRDSLSVKPHYKTNLITLPGTETLRILLDHGPGLFADRFTIGAWQWELPFWPQELHDAYRLVQELWAPSDYIARAFRESAPVEVIYMPMAVEIDHVPNLVRADFGLPAAAFIFLFVFDSLSHFARKNPLATICAFQRAFPRIDDNVRLVIKCMNASAEDPGWCEIEKACGPDSRIITINDTFSRDRVVGLINCCDALVSLHRAEGFGRTMAEAMLLGKPVVATNYSGNTDFTNPETAFLVDGKLRPLIEGEYPFWQGQYWMEPDQDHAKEQLRMCRENYDLAHQRAVAGKAWIESRFNPAVVGKRWIARLRELGIVSSDG